MPKTSTDLPDRSADRERSPADEQKVDDRLRPVRKILSYYLAVLLSAAVVAYWASFPSNAAMFEYVRLMFSRDVETGIGFGAKIKAALDISPSYLIVPAHVEGERRYTRVTNARLRERRRAAPLVWSSGEARNDYVLIVGAIDSPTALHGALLIDRKGDVVRQWSFRNPPLAEGYEGAESRAIPHGSELFEDGSVITAFDNGVALVKYDACSRVVWKVDGPFHNSVTRDPDDPGAVWTWRRTSIVKVGVDKGDIRKEISFFDIVDANPSFDIFGVRQEDNYFGSVWMKNAAHPNDVDPLPAAFADKFPQFEAGDLLISYRSLNLIFVIDPDTLAVKWFAFGYWRRQHDPDWGADGRIYVYDNNMNRGYSHIEAIDPQTMQVEHVIDGAEYGFYSRVRGKQQELANGDRLITVPDQGRVFEINRNGDVNFEFINLYDEETDEALVITEAKSFSENALNVKDWPSCEGT